MDDKLTAFLAKLARDPTAELRDVSSLRAAMEGLGQRAGLPERVRFEQGEVAGRPCAWFEAQADGPVMLYLHGGGYVAGSPASHRHVCGLLALEVGGTVFAPAYRLAPETPCPAGLNDTLAAYRELSRRFAGRAIAVVGDSAGGGLAFVTALRLRDSGDSMPSCIAGLSPWVNHALTNVTFDAPVAFDPTLSRGSLEWYSSLYAPGFAVENPVISPMFSDLRGLPPVMIQVGGREVLRGDGAKFHEMLQQAGVASRLEIWPDLFHAWHLFWPWLQQGRDALSSVAAFVQECAHGSS